MPARRAVAAALLLWLFFPLIRAAVAREGRFNEVLMDEELRLAEEMNRQAMDSLGRVSAANSPPAGPELADELAEARRAFFEAYRTREGLPQAGARFSSLLARKDAALLWNELWIAGTFGQDHTYRAVARTDGGVIPGAQREFNDWVEVIKSKAEGSGGPLGERIRRIQLIGQFTRYQEAYVAARTWAEFDRAQVRLAPEAFTLMLVQRYPIAKGPAEAEPSLKALGELFGEQRLLEAAAKLIPLPRDAANRCADLQGIGLDPKSKELAGRRITATRDVRPLDPTHVYVAFVALLARDNPQRAFLADTYTGAWNSTDREDWVRLRDAYRRLVLAYGQQRVDDAAQGYAATGANVWHKLAADDLDGYLRVTLAGGEQLNTRDALDARIAELRAHAGEAAVRDVVTRVRDAHIAGEDLKRFGSGLGDPHSAIVSTLQPGASNNPWYRAWARFPVGAKAVYKHADGSEWTYELAETGPKSVIVNCTRRWNDFGTPRDSSERFELPAALDPAIATSPGSHTRAFMHRLHYSGNRQLTTSMSLARIDPTPEVFKLGERSLQCTKRIGLKPAPTRAQVVWMCDDVPGGVVRVEVINGHILDQLVADLFVLQGFEGKPDGASATAKGGACLNCAAALATGASTCKTCGVAVGADPEIARVKTLAADVRRQQEEARQKQEEARRKREEAQRRQREEMQNQRSRRRR